jgi:ketosteroid isomerase-like protein
MQEKTQTERRLLVAFLFGLSVLGCHNSRPKEIELNPEQINHAIAELRMAYAAFNRGDIDAAVRVVDKGVEWSEPVDFPGGGTYHGIEGVKHYLTQSRASAAQVISVPERFIPAGDLIVVFVYARVLPIGSSTWQEVRLADVYRFRNGKAVEMNAFSNRRDALRWVGLEEKMANE